MTQRNIILLGFLFVAVFMIGLFKLIDHARERREEARQARYQACLTRTTPAVCELHLVHFPTADSSSGGPGIVISPTGQVGIGVGF